MNQHSVWTEEVRRLDDALFAGAWEEVGDKDRALLKTAIAWHFHRLGRCSGKLSRESSSFSAGFALRFSEQPAPWVLAVLEEGFASPARLLAGIVPAILAGVPQITAAASSPPPPAVLAALELAGIEDVFLAGQHGAESMLRDYARNMGNGRLLHFCGTHPCRDRLSACAGGMSIPCMHIPSDPRILLLPSASGSAERELHRRIALFHPDAHIIQGEETMPFADAAYGASLDTPLSPHCSALYGEGMEACWQGPGTEFFRSCSSAAFLAKEEEA